MVFLSDTRTNAGVDNIARYRKTFNWCTKGDRAITVVTAGNLSITQSVITRLNQATQRARNEDVECIMNAESMYRVVQLVGDAMRKVQDQDGETLEAFGERSSAAIIVGGQRRGRRHRLFQVYSAGNFIEATPDTHYFQLSEHKYGKPILDRVLAVNTSMKDAMKVAMVSMGSTLRSNLTVGMPLDLTVIRGDTLDFKLQRCIAADDSEFAAISGRWSHALLAPFQTLPDVTEG